MGSLSISSRLVQLPSEFCISSSSIVMLRCSRSAGASMTLTVNVPLFARKPGSPSDGILKPATAMLPIISVARSMPMAAKNPALWMLSDILLCSHS